MYQSYHSTKWPIVPATMLTGRRGRFRTSESPGELEVPRASGEFVVIEALLGGVMRWLVWCRGWVGGWCRAGNRQDSFVEDIAVAVGRCSSRGEASGAAAHGFRGPVELVVPGAGRTSR